MRRWRSSSATAPHRLVATWFGDELRFELHPAGDGCVLVFTHAFADRDVAARTAAGWDRCFARLEALFAGRPMDEPTSLQLWPGRARALRRALRRGPGDRPPRVRRAPTDLTPEEKFCSPALDLGERALGVSGRHAARASHGRVCRVALGHHCSAAPLPAGAAASSARPTSNSSPIAISDDGAGLVGQPGRRQRLGDPHRHEHRGRDDHGRRRAAERRARPTTAAAPTSPTPPPAP